MLLMHTMHCLINLLTVIVKMCFSTLSHHTTFAHVCTHTHTHTHYRCNFDRNVKHRGTYRVKRPKIHRALLSMNATEADTTNILRQSQTDDEKLLSAVPSINTQTKLKRNKTFTKSEHFYEICDFFQDNITSLYLINFRLLIITQ